MTNKLRFIVRSVDDKYGEQAIATGLYWFVKLGKDPTQKFNIKELEYILAYYKTISDVLRPIAIVHENKIVGLIALYMNPKNKKFYIGGINVDPKIGDEKKIRGIIQKKFGAVKATEKNIGHLFPDKKSIDANRKIMNKIARKLIKISLKIV